MIYHHNKRPLVHITAKIPYFRLFGKLRPAETEKPAGMCPIHVTALRKARDAFHRRTTCWLR